MHFPSPITSNQNSWVKSVLKLHRSSQRREQARFLIEGTHLIQEAIATRWPLEAICFDAHWAEHHRTLLDSISRQAEYQRMLFQPVSSEVLKKLSTTDSPCSVIGIAHWPQQREPSNTPCSLRIAVESLQDPGNLGALIRIAAAAGIEPVVISQDSVDVTNPKVLRSTAGQWFRNVPTVADLPNFIASQKSKKIQVLAAAADGISFWQCDLTKPTLFLLGNEGEGLSEAIRRTADASVAIPMASGVESLNVSVSGALLVYEAQRQRGLLG